MSRKLEAFVHVVDYYYRKAGLEMPEPAERQPDSPPVRLRPQGEPRSVSFENEQVLSQILLHLDCDGIEVFHLNDVRNLLGQDRTPKGRGYLSVLQHCFKAMRNGFHDRPTNDATWRECHDPALMLDHLRDKVSERKLRLFAVACCHRVPHLLADEKSQRAVDVAERYADGTATAEDLAVETRTSGVSDIRGHYGPVAAWAVAPSADLAARNTSWNAFCDRDGMGEERVQAALLRCICGNPFRPVTPEPSWLTDAVVSLARQMYESRDFSAMPILADALQDANCTDEAILKHCRGPGPHVRGCWVVDLILQKS